MSVTSLDFITACKFAEAQIWDHQASPISPAKKMLVDSNQKLACVHGASIISLSSTVVDSSAAAHERAAAADGGYAGARASIAAHVHSPTHCSAIPSFGSVHMSLKMLQPCRGSNRDRTGLYYYILGFTGAFAAAWVVVSHGHNGSSCCPRGAAMEHAPGRLRAYHRRVPAITLALVGAEEIRR